MRITQILACGGFVGRRYGSFAGRFVPNPGFASLTWRFDVEPGSIRHDVPGVAGAWRFDVHGAGPP